MPCSTSSRSSAPRRCAGFPGCRDSAVDPLAYARQVVRTLREHLLPGSLPGAWLIGSIAWDDYRPGSSDVDILAVAETHPEPVRRALADALIALPRPDGRRAG